MKKLLSILSSLCLVSSTSLSVISCNDSTEDKHLDSDGNSVWAWLPGLSGNQTVNSKNVWNEITPFNDVNGNWSTNPKDWDPKTQENAAIQILRILNVSLLANVDQLNSYADISKYADYSNLISLLSQQWKTLQNNVDHEVENQIQQFKDKGKDWQKQWQKFLDDGYDGSEQKYRAFLMASGSSNGGDSGTSLLKSTLISQQFGYYETAAGTINSNYINNASDLVKWASQAGNEEAAREVALGYTDVYDNTNKLNSLWKNDQDNTITLDQVKTRIGELASDPNTKNKYPINVPVKTFKGNNIYSDRAIDNTNSSLNGYFSEIQRYELKRWFTMNKPVATSQIDIPFDSDSDKFDNGLTLDDFKKSKDLMTSILAAKSWDELATSTDTKIKVTFNSDLLTLGKSGSKGADVSTTIKTSVYDALTKDAPIADKWSALGTNQTDLDAFIKQFNRDRTTQPNTNSQNKSMYYTFRLGSDNPNDQNCVIACVDDNGLHLIHVDGFNPTDGVKSNVSSNWKVTNEQKAQNVDRFKYVMNSTNQIATQSVQISDFINPAATNSNVKSGGTWAFNQEIPNRYLQFLTNFGNKTFRDEINHYTYYNFSDVSSLISGFANLDANTAAGSTDWYTWSYDIFNHLFNDVLGIPTEDWLSKFITIKGSDGTNYTSWFKKEMSIISDSFGTIPAINNFKTVIEKENQTIDGYKSTFARGRFDPDFTYANLINADKIDAKNSIDIWQWFQAANKNN